jgi:hypothetical protein
VRSPGVKLAPAGITARELIDEYCGGMLDGHAFKGYLPGGASGGILPASMADLPLEFGKLEKHGCFVGSHAVVVLSDQDDMKDVALNLMRFFEDESCGQCTPCRVGTEKAVADAQRPGTSRCCEELAADHGDASICGLGQAAANPLLSVLKHFPRGSAHADEVIRFTLDGRRSRRAPARPSGRSRQRNGTDIPHLCYAPEPGYRPTATAAPAWSRSRASGCWPPPASASPTEGMVVITASERAEKARAW